MTNLTHTSPTANADRAKEGAGKDTLIAKGRFLCKSNSSLQIMPARSNTATYDV